MIGIKYSLILALVVAFIDLLPVLGVGTVLIPWGLIGLISGDVRTGVGLLILFGIMSVIRQFSEPHIIGTALGIHPLLALIAVYCGMELFGLCGLIFAPVVLYLMRSFSPSAEKKDDGKAEDEGYTKNGAAVLRQPRYRLILCRNDHSVISVVPAVNHAGFLGFAVREYEERMSEKVHLKNSFLRRHRLETE